jgi:hypothetical protein
MSVNQPNSSAITWVQDDAHWERVLTRTFHHITYEYEGEQEGYVCEEFTCIFPNKENRTVYGYKVLLPQEERQELAPYCGCTACCPYSIVPACGCCCGCIDDGIYLHPGVSQWKLWETRRNREKGWTNSRIGWMRYHWKKLWEPRGEEPEFEPTFTLTPPE